VKLSQVTLIVARGTNLRTPCQLCRWSVSRYTRRERAALDRQPVLKEIEQFSNRHSTTSTHNSLSSVLTDAFVRGRPRSNSNACERWGRSQNQALLDVRTLAFLTVYCVRTRSTATAFERVRTRSNAFERVSKNATLPYEHDTNTSAANRFCLSTAARER